MRVVSIKAVIIANVASFVIAILTLTVGAGGAGLFVGLWNVASDDAHKITTVLHSSALLSLFLTITFVSASLGAGYLAARVARNSHALNGALACALWPLLNLYERVAGPIFAESSQTGSQSPHAHVPSLLWVVLVYGSPLLGALGGMLARWRDEERAAAGLELSVMAGLRQGAGTIVRWFAAFVVAGFIYTLLLALAGLLGGAVAALGACVFGLVISVVVGAALVRPHQRRAASFVLMALAVLLPATIWIGHAAAGDPQLTDFLFVFINLMGVGLSWLSLTRAYPQQFPSKPGPWWWLTMNEYARWSGSERRARMALGFAGLTVSTTVLLIGQTLLGWAGASMNVALPAAALACLPSGFLLARPIATWLFPDVVRQADANAAARLAGYDKVF